jgi:hypothetical protein
MRCPKCGHDFPNPTASAGGKARCAKGFASHAVMRKALATRARNRRAKLTTHPL